MHYITVTMKLYILGVNRDFPEDILKPSTLIMFIDLVSYKLTFMNRLLGIGEFGISIIFFLAKLQVCSIT